MSTQVQLWREVSLHLNLGESIERIRQVMDPVLPLRRLAVRRVDVESGVLRTVAESRAGGGFASAGNDVDLIAPAVSAELSVFARSGGVRIVDAALRSGPLALLTGKSAPPLGHAVVGGLGEIDGVTAVLVAIARSAIGPDEIELFSDMLEPVAVAIRNDVRVHELDRLRNTLEADNRALRDRLGRQDIAEAVVGESTGLREAMERVQQVAPTDAPVLLFGETGSGKEVVARTVHARSKRASGPMLRVNCGAIAPELIDSELFGHEKGAFTGAVSEHRGWFERADGGTLFLDEIGELPLAAQVRLLRVLQDGTLTRVGAQNSIRVDVRIVAATHRDLRAMSRNGGFREDLWYRLSVFPITLPPLRERLSDLPALSSHFAASAGRRLGGSALVPSADDIALMLRYDWPGNVRELAAVIERAAILGNGRALRVAAALGVGDARPSIASTGASPFNDSTASASVSASHGTLPIMPPAYTNAAAVDSPAGTELDEAMRAHIERVLSTCHGRVDGPFGAARALGINPQTLRSRMRRLGIAWAKFRAVDAP